MKYTWPRLLKLFTAVSLVAVLGFIAFPFIRDLNAERLRANLRVDAQRSPLIVFVLIDTLRRDHVHTLAE